MAQGFADLGGVARNVSAKDEDRRREVGQR